MVSQFLYFDCFMSRWRHLDLAHWPSFARWPSTLLVHWSIIQLASSINIPQWQLTHVELEIEQIALTTAGENYVASTIRTTRACCHNLCALRLVERQLTSFPYVIRISGILPCNRNVTQTLECTVLSHGSIMLPPSQPRVFARLARWQ